MSSDGQRRIERWIERRLPEWQRLDAQLPALEDRRPLDPEIALEAIRQYPEVARDLALAARSLPDGRVTVYLEQVYGRLHRALFRPPRAPLGERLLDLGNELPAVCAELRWHIAAVTIGFLLALTAGWWLVATFPELVSLFASEAMIATVQRGELWTDGLLNVAPSALLSIGIFTNNITVALTAVSLGLLYGLGTIYIIGLNGLMLGGVFAFTAQHGLGWRLFEFVCAHGFVELTAICLSGAIGWYLGEALARPEHLTRIAALQQRARRVSGLIATVVSFLVLAGLIEGYLSPDPAVPLSVRLAVGLGSFAVLVLLLGGRWPLGRRRRLRSGAPSATSGTAPAPARRAGAAR